MCQVGGILNIKKNDPESQKLIANTAKFMLSQMALGNQDGSGLAISYKNEELVYTLKSKTAGDDLAKTLEIDTSKPLRHVLLHTRYATQGSKNELNAHPHRGPRGYMVHNGWCPTLFLDMVSGLHHKQTSIDKKFEFMNQKGLLSECDSEALAMVFNPDPKVMDEYLVGDEIFALLHIENTGKNVTLMTQYNTVHMAYSSKLDAVLVATREFVLTNTLKWLGEGWPVVEVDHDQVFYFDGDIIQGKKASWGKRDRSSKEGKYIGYSTKGSKHTKYYGAWKGTTSPASTSRNVSPVKKKKTMGPTSTPQQSTGGAKATTGIKEQESQVKEYAYNPDTDAIDLIMSDPDIDDYHANRRKFEEKDNFKVQSFLDKSMDMINSQIIRDYRGKK